MEGEEEIKEEKREEWRRERREGRGGGGGRGKVKNIGGEVRERKRPNMQL